MEEMDEIHMDIPKKKNVTLIVLLSVITLGIYPYIWYIKRVKEFNNLQTDTKAKKSVPVISLVLMIFVFIGIASIATILKIKYDELSVATGISDIPTYFIIIFISVVVIVLILWILRLMMSFKYAKILNEALNNKGSNIKISGILTFLFKTFYLQYEINKIINDKESEKRSAPWIVLLIVLLIITGLSVYFYLNPDIFS